MAVNLFGSRSPEAVVKAVKPHAALLYCAASEMDRLLAEPANGIHLAGEITTTSGSMNDTIRAVLRRFPTVVYYNKGGGVHNSSQGRDDFLALCGVVLRKLMGFFESVDNDGIWLAERKLIFEESRVLGVHTIERPGIKTVSVGITEGVYGQAPLLQLRQTLQPERTGRIELDIYHFTGDGWETQPRLTLCYGQTELYSGVRLPYFGVAIKHHGATNRQERSN